MRRRELPQITTGSADLHFAEQVVPHAADTTALALQIARMPGTDVTVQAECFQVAAESEHVRSTVSDWLRARGFDSLADHHSSVVLERERDAQAQAHALRSLAGHQLRSVVLAGAYAPHGGSADLVRVARDLAATAAVEADRLRALAQLVSLRASRP